MMKTAHYGKMARTWSLVLIAAAFLLSVGLPSPAQAQINCGSSGTADDGSCLCPNRQLATGISNSIRSYMALSQYQAQDYAQKTWQAEAETPVRYVRGDIRVTYCIGDINTYFDRIKRLISGDWIIDFLQDIVDDVLNMICDVVGSIIDNALNMICLPMIDILPSISLPGNPLSSRRSCSGGMSLADVIQVTPAPLFEYTNAPSSYMSYPMSRMVNGGRY